MTTDDSHAGPNADYDQGEAPPGLAGPELADWCLQRCEALLRSGAISTRDADVALGLATTGMEVADGERQSALAEMAVLASLTCNLGNIPFPTGYGAWVEGSASLGLSKTLASLVAELDAALRGVHELGHLRHLVWRYQSLLLSSWEAAVVEAGPDSVAQQIHVLSFLQASILVFDATGIPAALAAAERLCSDRLLAGPDLVTIRLRARTLLRATDEYVDEAELGLHEIDTIIPELSASMSRAKRGLDGNSMDATTFRDRLIDIDRVLTRCDDPVALRVRLEAARQMRILGRESHSLEDLRNAENLLERLLSETNADPDEITGEQIRLRVDQYDVSRQPEYIIDANDAANVLLDQEHAPLNNPELVGAISLARYKRFLLMGLLADLEESHLLNEMALELPNRGDALTNELLINGAAILRNVYAQNGKLTYARDALDVYLRLLAMSVANEASDRRKVLHNTIALLITADELLEEPVNRALLETCARELRDLCNGEPRYLLMVAHAYREFGGDREELALATLDLVAEALCGAVEAADVATAFVALSACISRVPNWAGPEGAIYSIFASLVARDVGAAIHFQAATAAIRAMDHGSRFDGSWQTIAYSEFVTAARRLLASQVSGDERRHWLEHLDGFPAKVLVGLAQVSPRRAVEIAEAARALVGIESLSLLSGDYDAGSEADVLAALEDLRSARIAADFSSDRQIIHSARLRMERAQGQLRDLGHGRASAPLAASGGEDFGRLQATLGAIPSYYLALDRGTIVAVRVAADADPIEVMRAAPRGLAETADAFLDAYQSRRSDFIGWAAAVRNVGAQLWEDVIGPLLATVDTSMTSLSLVTCGALSLLPFQVAWTPEQCGRRYLIDDYDVTYSPGLSFGLLGGKQLPVGQGLVGVAVGDPVRSLKWISAEERSISRQFDGRLATRWASPDAGSEAVLDLAEGARYLHIAAHGEARLHSNQAGYVQLATDRLDEMAVVARRLHNLELVVLSACDSGRIDRELPDELRGLPLAFLAAGARSVVSTAWPCDDLVAAWLMSEFYEQLASGETPHHALRVAQGRIRHGEPVAATAELLRELGAPWRAVYSHEVYWGAFFAVGSP